MLVKQVGNVYKRCCKLTELFHIYKVDLLKTGCFIIGFIAVILAILIIGELV